MKLGEFFSLFRAPQVGLEHEEQRARIEKKYENVESELDNLICEIKQIETTVQRKQEELDELVASVPPPPPLLLVGDELLDNLVIKE